MPNPMTETQAKDKFYNENVEEIRHPASDYAVRFGGLTNERQVSEIDEAALKIKQYIQNAGRSVSPTISRQPSITRVSMFGSGVTQADSAPGPNLGQSPTRKPKTPGQGGPAE